MTSLSLCFIDPSAYLRGVEWGVIYSAETAVSLFPPTPGPCVR